MKKKKQEETKKTAESVNILESVPPTSPAPPKEAEKLDIFSIGDLSGLTLNNSTPATTTQTTNPGPAPGSFDLYGTKQPSYPQQFYQQPMQGVLPGVPYGYPYGQAQNMMPLNQIAYGGGYNGQSHVGATFQQSPASYPFNAGKPSSTVPITGANLYASPPTKWSTNSNGFVNINITVWMLSIDINLAQSSIWGGIPKCRTTKQKYSAHLFSAFICVACTLEHESMTKDTSTIRPSIPLHQFAFTFPKEKIWSKSTHLIFFSIRCLISSIDKGTRRSIGTRYTFFFSVESIPTVDFSLLGYVEG